VVQGTEDQYGSAAQVDTIVAQALNAMPAMVEQCGHTPHQEQPQALLALMEGFARAHGYAAAREDAMISRLDHLVLTTRDKAACIDFYTRVLGMQLETFGAGRQAFKFGAQNQSARIRQGILPRPRLPTPGSLDLCFIAAVPLDALITHLSGRRGHRGGPGGPGANWPIRSICATRTAT
jgi:hypothetical protein